MEIRCSEDKKVLEKVSDDVSGAFIIPRSKLKPKPTDEMKLLGMKFSVNDINHIILNYESQIPKFISSLRKIHSIGNDVLTSEDMDLLISKVTSFEKIAQDY